MVFMWTLSSAVSKRSIISDNIEKALDVYWTYEKVMRGGDFNS